MQEERQDEVIIYQTEDGLMKIDVVMQGETVWLTREQMSRLFDRSVSVIGRHINNVFGEKELPEESNVQKMHIAGSDKPVAFYSLDVIISVGYRVKSLRGTQFRIWATSILREYLVKGFALNDDTLKNAGKTRYFEELLERIRDIRSSEKVFWRKVLDIYATSVDYSSDAETSRLFFKTVQNKMLYAATGHTAAELICGRVDAQKPLMGLTVTKGEHPTLSEVMTAKNYLSESELGTLNRLVSAYLDLAELQAHRRRPMYMKDWLSRLDDYLRMTDSEILENSGSVAHALAEKKAKAEYDKYKRLRDRDASSVELAFLASLGDAAGRFNNHIGNTNNH